MFSQNCLRRSLGVTTYVLLTGFSPFGGESDQETFCNISRGEVDLPDELFEDISEDALNFIKALLVKDPRYAIHYSLVTDRMTELSTFLSSAQITVNYGSCFLLINFIYDTVFAV